MSGVNSTDRRNEIVRRYQGGETLRAIASALGIDDKTVLYHVRKAGVHVPVKSPPFRFTPEMDAQIRDRYPEHGAVPLATEFGCKVTTVSRRAYSIGLTSLNHRRHVAATQARTRANVRLDFFDHWTPEMAYVLGYIWADGCVSCRAGRPRRIVFLCTEGDGQLLRDVAGVMGCRSVIRKHGSPDGRSATAFRSRDALTFSVNSRVLAQAVMDVHGIPPRKSSCDPPYPTNVPDDMLAHFARGNLDGDGSVVVGRRCSRINWLGSQAFVRGLASQIVRAAGVRQPSFYTPKDNPGLLRAAWVAKADLLRLAGWLYRDAGLCLARKRVKCEEVVRRLTTSS